MKNKTNLTLALCSLLLITLIIINPSKYTTSCLNGFVIFGTKVLPALFPFFFLTKLLTETGIINTISNKLNPVMQKLFKTNGASAYIYLMSMLSGYPVGAKLTADFYEKKIIDENEAFRICTFTSTSGPNFILATVGVAMFASVKIGIIILVSHFIGAFLNGIFFRNYKSKNFKIKSQNAPVNLEKNMISDCMYNALVSIMMVGGFIAFFTVIIDAILFFPLFSNSFLQVILSGLIEITRGCLILSSIAMPTIIKTTLATFFISFGGLCIQTQAYTFLKKCKIKMRLFFLQKLSHSLISAILCFLICLIFF